MYCHKCGTKNTDDAVFCYKCGSNLRGITSPSKKIIIFLICLLIAVSIFIGKLPSWKGDPYGTLIVSQSIIQNRTLNLNKVKRYWGINPVEYPHESYNYQVYRRDDNVYFSYPLGTSIISIPFVSIANTCGLNMLQHEKLMQEILASTVAIGIFLTIFIISLEYFSFVYSIFIGLIGFYGTTVGTVVGTGLWDSDYELFFSGLSILLIFLYAKKNYKIYIKGIELSSVLTGLFFLLAFISRPTASILIFSIFVFLILYDKRYF
ncbi:MAG: zinc ribbon domain-containing protein, partial [Deltaproteobacteria bacterium]|nr:zinc ribbon domain-containing protein [Deltaproteobacteria bacterium]